MHIEPGVVNGAKMLLSYGTGAAVLGYAAKLAWDTMRREGLGSFAVRAIISTAAVFTFFEIMPHYAVGVSEVHFIFGTTLYLLFGLAPAAFGLAAGLLLQGLFFAPFDLPQYGINITTLLVPLYAVDMLARRIIPRDTAYVDLKYAQVLPLSAMFQAGIVSWVTFWALYGQGFTAENLQNILRFDAAYLLVITVEPIVDLLVLAGAKFLRRLQDSGLFTRRLFAPAA
jgi:ABC-type Co2+ transport system permease subunit